MTLIQLAGFSVWHGVSAVDDGASTSAFVPMSWQHLFHTLVIFFITVLNAIAEDSDNVPALVADYLQNEGTCSCTVKSVYSGYIGT